MSNKITACKPRNKIHCHMQLSQFPITSRCSVNHVISMSHTRPSHYFHLMINGWEWPGNKAKTGSHMYFHTFLSWLFSIASLQPVKKSYHPSLLAIHPHSSQLRTDIYMKIVQFLLYMHNSAVLQWFEGGSGDLTLTFSSLSLVACLGMCVCM